LRALSLPVAARPHIPGLSAGTNHAIRLTETRMGMAPGVVAKFYRRYRTLVGRPGSRWLELASEDNCPCGFCEPDPVEELRDLLDQVLRRLPPKAQGELTRLLAPLDAAFLRRTWLDRLISPGDPWWWRRVRPRPMMASD
jgi:hypothetical protein